MYTSIASEYDDEYTVSDRCTHVMSALTFSWKGRRRLASGRRCAHVNASRSDSLRRFGVLRQRPEGQAAVGVQLLESTSNVRCVNSERIRIIICLPVLHLVGNATARSPDGRAMRRGPCCRTRHGKPFPSGIRRMHATSVHVLIGVVEKSCRILKVEAHAPPIHIVYDYLRAPLSQSGTRSALAKTFAHSSWSSHTNLSKIHTRMYKISSVQKL